MVVMKVTVVLVRRGVLLADMCVVWTRTALLSRLTVNTETAGSSQMVPAPQYAASHCRTQQSASDNSTTLVAV
jgi:hypothetical protein